MTWLEKCLFHRVVSLSSRKVFLWKFPHVVCRCALVIQGARMLHQAGKAGLAPGVPLWHGSFYGQVPSDCLPEMPRRQPLSLCSFQRRAKSSLSLSCPLPLSSRLGMLLFLNLSTRPSTEQMRHWDGIGALWQGWAAQRMVCSRRWLTVRLLPPPLGAGEIAAVFAEWGCWGMREQGS